ncbi:MAG: OsmC family protein [Planctomycetota bacterium]
MSDTSSTQHTATAITGKVPFKTHIETDGTFNQVTDTPESMGGSNLGASPTALVSAALASCKSITAKMYADRKGWPVDAIRVDVEHIKRDGKDVFETLVTIDGDGLDDEQRKRIYEITAKCPVHKLLVGETAVESSLAD